MSSKMCIRDRLHSHLQVVGGENVRPEKHRGQLVPGITAGLQELRDDILKGGNTCAQLLGGLFLPEGREAVSYTHLDVYKRQPLT